MPYTEDEEEQEAQEADRARNRRGDGEEWGIVIQGADAEEQQDDNEQEEFQLGSTVILKPNVKSIAPIASAAPKKKKRDRAGNANGSSPNKRQKASVNLEYKESKEQTVSFFRDSTPIQKDFH